MTAWQNDYVVKNKFSRPGFPLLKVLGVVMHWTATPGATDENEKAFFDGADGGGSRYASAHIFVDKDSARLIIPLNEVAYHANEKAPKVAKLKATASYYTSGNANLNTIGVEMCVEKDGTIHADTIKRTEDVVAELCRQFNLNPASDIYRHYDITGKNCPAPWVSDVQKFEDFKKKVNIKLNGYSTPDINGPLYGVAVINYPIGYGVNTYDAPKGTYKGRVSGQEAYRVYFEKDGYYDIGGSTWVPKKHCIYKKYVATVKVPKGYGVNVYGAPNGTYKNRIYGGESYVVYAEKDGWYDIGQSTWVSGEYVKISY